MKTKYLKCKSCGFEKKYEVYSPEEIIKHNIPTSPMPRVCPKCGSPNIEIKE